MSCRPTCAARRNPDAECVCTEVEALAAATVSAWRIVNGPTAPNPGGEVEYRAVRGHQVVTVIVAQTTIITDTVFDQQMAVARQQWKAKVRS